jgi:hypothetical protein
MLTILAIVNIGSLVIIGSAAEIILPARNNRDKPFLSYHPTSGVSGFRDRV